MSISLYNEYYFGRYWRLLNNKIYGSKYSIIYPDELSVEFLNSIIKDSKDSTSKIVEYSIGNPLEGGFIGNIVKISLKWNNENESEESRPNSVIFKSLIESYENVRLSGQRYSYRECSFYQFNNEMIKIGGNGMSSLEFIPKVYYFNKTKVGSFCIIMQDISELTNDEIKQQSLNGIDNKNETSFQKKYITACKALGNQCWGLPSTFKLELFDPYQILETCFLETSKLHIEYFRDFNLVKDKNQNGVDMTWLKNHNIYNAVGKREWEAFRKYLIRCWYDTAVPKIEKYKNSLNQPDLLLKVADEFYNNYFKWDQLLKRIDIYDPTCPFTLTHGDFHAGNTMIPNPQFQFSSSSSSSKPFYLLDWSEAGINDPFADISQFIISNVSDVKFRRENEEKLFKSYWNNLIKSGKVSIEHFPFDYCYQLYKRGGIERWIVLDSMMSTMVDGDHFIYFFNQLSNFLIDHYNKNTFKLL